MSKPTAFTKEATTGMFKVEGLDKFTLEDVLQVIFTRDDRGDASLSDLLSQVEAIMDTGTSVTLVKLEGNELSYLLNS